MLNMAQITKNKVWGRLASLRTCGDALAKLWPRSGKQEPNCPGAINPQGMLVGFDSVGQIWALNTLTKWAG